MKYIKLLCIAISAVLCTLSVICPGLYVTADDSISATGKTDSAELEEHRPYMSDVLSGFPETAGTDSLTLEYAQAKGEFTTDVILDRPAAVISDGDGYISWDFTVTSAGRYYVSAEYAVIGASRNNASVTIELDGETPYFESENIKLFRQFRDEEDVGVNSQGDEVRPAVSEVEGWQFKELRDSGGFYSTPLIFWIEPGQHTIALRCISFQSFALRRIEIRPYTNPKPYSELVKDYPGDKGGSGIIQVYQAEDSLLVKNDATIRVESDGDPATEPIAYGYRVFNSVGGFRWRNGNQSATFGFDVEKSGYYQIGIRFLQAWNDGIPSYRRIAIDGEVPCAELMECRFDYSSDWQTKVLSTEGGEPLLFYFEKGSHTLEMTTVVADITPVIQNLFDDMTLLSKMLLDITMLTGNQPDPNYDYQFYKFLPDLEGQFNALITSLKANHDRVFNLSKRNTSMGSNFKSIIKQLTSMRDNPFTIARRYNQLSNLQENLGNWYLDYQKSPLLIDEFTIASSDTVIRKRSASLFAKIKSTFKNFITSFFKDYNGIGSTIEDSVKITDEISVWIARGTEWGEAVQQMTDSTFTPKTGVRVKMRVVPSSQLNTGSTNVLLLSIISGTAPDVALGVSANSPVEFAMRQAVADLSQFEDYDDVCKRFLENTLISYRYQGGHYALPETMNFNCIYYRKDILKKYNISVPDTRDQLYYETLPALYQNGMKFSQPRDYMQFLYQNGGQLYTDDGRFCALDTPVAIGAFKEFTEIFTHYACELNANFFNRFRSGEMPIGIAGYSMYLQLATAAPELTGKWSIAPMIGVPDNNGDIDRTSVGFTGTCGIILQKDNKKKLDSSWEYLKWWTDTDTQMEFAGEIESLVGVEGRWNSANLDAFKALDWDSHDLSVINEQFRWMTDTPIVPGGYYTGTYINNAFTDVVISEKMSYRDALEAAVKSINRELMDKQKEYGLYE